MKERNVEASNGRRLSASKGLGKLLIAGSTATASLTNPAIVTADPGGGDGYIDTQDFPLARFRFGGSITANQTVDYQITAWMPVFEDGPGNGSLWLPTIVAAGRYTLGATILPTWMYAANGLMADIITETIGSGAVLRSPADDSIATLDIPIDNAQYLLVETDVVSATSADVFVQLGEPTAKDADDYVRSPVALGSKTASNSAWDNDSHELAIPANAEYLHVACPVKMWLIANNLTADPNPVPAWYGAGQAAVIECVGQSLLHYKSADTDAQVIYVTAYVRS